VREERGLVYSIYSQLATFIDTGLMLVYAGTEAKKAPTVIELILKEIRRIKKQGMKRRELEFFKRQVKGQILLGADDIESRMNSLAVNEMVSGRYRSVEDIIRDVESVSLDSVHDYIETFFDLDKLGLLVMGPVPEVPMRRWLDGL
jgi:predicted Zn-dependent peptidase